MARYVSKIDRWLIVLPVAVGAVPTIALTGAAFYEPRLLQDWWIFLILAGAFGFVLWIFLSTYYELNDRELVVRSGPFRWHVPLDSIASVRPTRNPLSSPALSLDRLELRYGAGKWLLISPRDRDRFLADLADRAPQVNTHG